MAIMDETRTRARALQLLYAWEVQGEVSSAKAASGLERLVHQPRIVDQAETLANAVIADIAELDRHAEAAAENWRWERIATVERNILRLGVHELKVGDVPPKVAITEAVELARRFGGARAPAFVNGVLDRVARTLGRL